MNVKSFNVTANNAWTSAINVFGNVIFIDIQNTVSLDNTYYFNLNLDSPGPKKIVFHICQQAITDVMTESDTESESDSDATEIKTEDVEEGGNANDIEMKTKDTEVRINEIKVEDKDLAAATINPEFQPVSATPCILLTQHAGNPDPDPENLTAPWAYYVKQVKSETQE
ncbi:hypothetical protein BDR04DRAFT_1118613 [Suillus decipiens]|nr:hypothetical protein BDR04DRAFT_1118613 [Suillus decipiens]